MRIAIIGAGWLGCHLALKLKNKHHVTVFDETGIFSKASMNNQNRLHFGYHYARNSATRVMCKNTFSKFKNDYSEIIFNVPNNIYAIPERNSFIDFKTYVKIFADYDFQIADYKYLSNIDGAVAVNEKYIDPFLARSFFIKKIGDILTIKKITNIAELSSSYDLVINCTNNNLNPITEKSFIEPCTIFVYEKINKTEFDALTLVDGPLFSIFPFYKNTVTVSDVQYTPDSNLSTVQRIEKIEEKIMHYYPKFKNNFKYIGDLKATKAKPVDLSDSRVPTIFIEDNIINCFTGKIQGIYYLEEYVSKICEF